MPRAPSLVLAFAPALALALALIAPALPAAAQLSEIAPGVTRVYHRDEQQQINLAVVDLCQAGVSVRATRYEERGRTPSSFGRHVGAAVAVNGDFFGSGYGTDGLAMSGGALWPGSSDHTYVGPIGFGRNRTGLIEHWAERGPEPWMQEIVSGHPTIVMNGAVVDHAVDPMSSDPLCTQRNPRTGVGLSEDGRTLILAVVDGRRSTMIGMTCRELANLMIFWGAHTAMNLDGGGSSAMWMTGLGVVNSPSDGSERTTANHLAVIATGGGATPHCHRTWGAEWVGAGGWPGGTSMELEAGTEAEGWIELRNVGTETWTPANTRLGASEPRDGASPIASDGWLNPGRVVGVETEVPSGMTGRFRFSVRAPSTPGTYRQHFNVVEEGVTWFSDSLGPADSHMWLEVRSVPPSPTADAGAGALDAGAGEARSDAGPADPGTDGGGGGSFDGGGSSTARDASLGGSSGDAGRGGSSSGGALGSGCAATEGGGRSPLSLVALGLLLALRRSRRPRPRV